MGWLDRILGVFRTGSTQEPAQDRSKADPEAEVRADATPKASREAKPARQ